MFSDSYMIILKHYQAYLLKRPSETENCVSDGLFINSMDILFLPEPTLAEKM